MIDEDGKIEKWKCNICGRIIYAERSPITTSNNNPMPIGGWGCNIDRNKCRGEMKIVVKEEIKKITKEELKTIKIYTGDALSDLFEGCLHPKEQVKNVQAYLKYSPDNFKINSNSIYVVESFNKFGQLKGYKIEFYFNGEKVNPEVVFKEFEKPLTNLIFGNEQEI